MGHEIWSDAMLFYGRLAYDGNRSGIGKARPQMSIGDHVFHGKVARAGFLARKVCENRRLYL